MHLSFFHQNSPVDTMYRESCRVAKQDTASGRGAPPTVSDADVSPHATRTSSRRVVCTSVDESVVIASPARIKVAIVAPSLRILGGQAVQADRLLRAWRGDPDVDAWLVPVNPLPPRWLRWTLRVKYLRTIVTELIYLPLLARELVRAD